MFGGVVPGSKVHKGEALFPRIDVAKELELLEAEKQARWSMPRKSLPKMRKRKKSLLRLTKKRLFLTQRDLIQF